MLKNIITTFFARGLVALLNLAVLLLVSRELGSNVVGQISLLALNVAIIQIVNEIYTGPALVHFIPQFDLRRIFFTGIAWTFACTIIVNLIFIIFNVGIRELWTHVLFLSFVLSVHAFNVVILLGRNRIRQYNFLLFFQPAVLFATLCVSIFMLRIHTVSAYLIAMYFAYCSAALISFLLVLPALVKKEAIANPFSAFRVLKNGFSNQLGNLAHTLSNRFNYYMLGSTVIVGVYANATSLIESVWIISGSVSPIILTHIANQKQPEQDVALTFLLSKICLGLSCLCVLIVAVIPEGFFTLLLGRDFAGIKSIMLHLSPGILAISFITVISHYFSALGLQRVALLANGLGLITTLCLSYILISRFQVIGACYTATLSYLVAAVVFITVFMRMNNLGFRDLFSIRLNFHLLKNDRS